MIIYFARCFDYFYILICLLLFSHFAARAASMPTLASFHYFDMPCTRFFWPSFTVNTTTCHDLFCSPFIFADDTLLIRLYEFAYF